jgi:Ca-activated chloride channel family protein
MAFSQFHFLQSAWLWGLLAVPAVILLYALFYKTTASIQLLERFADRQLLPHLIRHRGLPTAKIRRSLLFWALAWLCAIVAMAGPSWNYTELQTFKGAANLIIVLDLSRTMNAQDVKPSRVARAREEIQDLLDLGRGTDIGLVAYAAVPHMVTPLTDDFRTIQNLLPDLDTSLVTLQGDRLQPALEMAARMLKAEPSSSNSILVISDGGFQEDDFAELARAAGGANIYAMGIGMTAGTFVPNGSGGLLQNTMGQATISRLQADRLQQLAAAGHGIYVEANYSDSDTRAILDRIDGAKVSATPKSIRVWENRYYIPLLLLIPLLLPLFRRGAAVVVVTILAVMVFPGGHARAITAADLFLNRNQQAEAAFDKRDYKSALAKFDTDYRRGVVAYRAGRYDKAAAYFQSAAKQTNSLNALYNLGNAQLMQFYPKDAIASYEAVLRRMPGHVSAQHNLTLARKMLEQQKQRPNQNDKSNQSKNNNGDGHGRQHDKGGQQGGQSQRGNGQGNGSNQSQPANQGKPQGQRQGKQGQQQQQQASSQPGSSQRQAQGKPERQGAGHENESSGSGGDGAPAGARTVTNGRSANGAGERAQLDVNADEWLNRVQSEPGSFLKNQFMIEDQKSGARQ